MFRNARKTSMPARGKKRAKKAATNTTNTTPTTNEDDNTLVNIQSSLDHIGDHPERFVQPDDELPTSIQQIVKDLYDYAKKNESKHTQWGALASLVVQGFDIEQIWGQLHLRNEPFLQHLYQQLDQFSDDNDSDSDSSSSSDDENAFADATSGARAMSEEEEENEDDDDDDVMIQSMEHDDDDDNDDDQQEQEEEEEDTEERRQQAIPDQFFSFAEMEAFANEPIVRDSDDDADDPAMRLLYGEEGNDDDDDDDEEEEEEDEEMEDGIDYKQLRYDDFFAPPNTRLKQREAQHQDELEEYVQLADNDDDDDDYDDNERPPAQELSKYERQKLERAKEIEALEEKIIRPRDWDQTGEVSARDRPDDSLLERPLEFDYIGSSAPLVTEEVTQTLEEMIRQRIINEEFDDVERKSIEEVKVFKPRAELSQEKSKLGLAEIYEKEYVEKVMYGDEAVGDRTGTGQFTTDAQEKLSAEHQEIARLFAKICYKLDGLTNFHFTPKPAVAELQITPADAPAITMEEIVPMGVSTAQLTAPEDVFRSAQRGNVVVQGEKSQEERQASRRAKKRRHQKREGARAAADKEEAMANPHSKKARVAADKRALTTIAQERNIISGKEVDTTQYTRSKAVFSRLEENKQTSASASSSSSAAKQSKKNKKDGSSDQQSKAAHAYKL